MNWTVSMTVTNMVGVNTTPFSAAKETRACKIVTVLFIIAIWTISYSVSNSNCW